MTRPKKCCGNCEHYIQRTITIGMCDARIPIIAQVIAQQVQPDDGKKCAAFVEKKVKR